MKLIRSDRKALFAFMAPALIVMLLFFVIPVLYVIVVSFLKWNGISAPVFNNLKNYALLTKDKSFSRSVINNIIWAVVAGFIQVPLAMVMAIILSRKPKGWKFFRTVYFFPQVISGIALATLWRAIYNAEHGMLNGLLSSVGLSSASKDWLGTIQTAFPAVLIYWVFYIGYYMVIMMADITTIDTSYYEAATIDGATRWNKIRHIDIPHLVPIAVMMLILNCGSLLSSNTDKALLLQTSGNMATSDILGVYVYNVGIAASKAQYSYASAIGLCLNVINFAIIMLVNAVSRRMSDISLF